MTNGFQPSYRFVGELPPGDALRAERAVTSAGAEVALKEIAPRDIARFLDEMAVVARIDDPHLESVVDSGRRGELAYVATELVDGVYLGKSVSAKARCRRRPSRPTGPRSPRRWRRCIVREWYTAASSRRRSW